MYSGSRIPTSPLALALAVGEGSPSLASAAAAVSRGQMDDLQATEETSFVAEDVNQVIKEVRPRPRALIFPTRCGARRLIDLRSWPLLLVRSRSMACC